MFGFGKGKEQKKVANKIGHEIHRQLLVAMEKDDNKAGEGITSSFSAGYITTFIWCSFSLHGMDGEKMGNKYFEYILTRVMPRLFSIVQQRLKALELAADLGKQNEVEQYEFGAEVGMYDAGMFDLLTPIKNKAANLEKHLLGKKLKYKKVT